MRLALPPAVLLTFVLSAPAAEPTRLQVVPDAIDLTGRHPRHGLLVTAVGADGKARDVTAEARFVSADPKLVGVGPGGECRAAGDGTATVTVEFAGQTVPVVVRVRDTAPPAAPSFLNEVIPVLTRLGCNQGACHGKGSGQNGFRLSLRGYAPEWDHDWLTHEFLGRRVNLTRPEEGLLLHKPLGRVPHEGGVLFHQGSRTYQTLLAWLKAGMPGADADGPKADQLEILPGDRLLAPGAEQQLLVRARFDDGTWADVTWLTKFASNDASVVTVDEHGKVRVLRAGETSVRAHYLDQVAVVQLTAPHDGPDRPDLYAGRDNFIDDHVFAKLRALRIEPSPGCEDATFVRRVFLDLIGCLPTVEETRAFLADGRPDRRARLIDALLERPEYVDFWTMKLADLVQNRRESDHDVRGAKGVRAFHQWLRTQVAVNRPWDQLARDVLTAGGTTEDNPAVGYFIVTVGEKREAHQSTVVAAVAQAFLGTRIGCAQCHNHPLEKYTQDDYYHFSGFFSRVKLLRKNPEQGPTELLVGTWNDREAKNPVGVVQPRTGKFLPPQPLDRSAVAVRPGDDPRQVLARWVTDPKNEYFSGAMVNRLWAHFFDVGLVEPVDDLRASNPPSNPALWQALAREFVSCGYDLKHMTRLLANSRAYQLGSRPTEANRRDRRFYSHFYARRLPAEVLLDAVAQATGVPEEFPGYPQGVRAVQVPDPAVPSYFLAMYGRSERISACACERNSEVTLPQVLHLFGGDTTGRKVNAPQGRVAKLSSGPGGDDAVIDELFLAALSRTPNAQEREAVRATLAGAENRRGAYADVLWALLNSAEFCFNH